jgi:outer membrane usher protein FimD/PapC
MVSSRRALASWGTSIGGVSVSANAEWQLSGAGGSGDSVYLNLSIPWAKVAGREPAQCRWRVPQWCRPERSD